MISDKTRTRLQEYIFYLSVINAFLVSAITLFALAFLGTFLDNLCDSPVASSQDKVRAIAFSLLFGGYGLIYELSKKVKNNLISRLDQTNRS